MNSFVEDVPRANGNGHFDLRSDLDTPLSALTLAHNVGEPPACGFLRTYGKPIHPSIHSLSIRPRQRVFDFVSKLE